MSALIRQGFARNYVRRIRLALMCFSVGANAICAGGVFCFPILSPALATHLKLTQPQLTTIAIAGIMGQYPFAAFVGKILDYYGAWACSLIAAGFFSIGFGLFANEISKAPDSAQPSASTFHHLVVYIFISGLGAVFSYFSSVFAASKNFPKYIGISAGISMALYGLSPTFLSLIASRYFSFPDGQVDVTHFLHFLVVLCGCVHLLGGLTMHVIPPISEEESKSIDPANDPEAPNERTSLLRNKTNGNSDEQLGVASDSPELKQTVLNLLSDRNFWILTFIVFVILGSCEMIISNIGTIVLSLPNQSPVVTVFGDSPSPALATGNQVRTLSIANTVSRLVVGPLADIVSPVPSHSVDSNRGTLRKHRISRIAFVTFSAAILVFTYAWMIVGVRDQASIWVLSIGAGLAYGGAFTVLPSLVSSIWGLSNLGRNYGILTYAPFLGTPAFSYLYAFVSDAHASSGVCHGPACWTLTFEVSMLAAALAFGASVYLWRVWKGRV